MVEPSSSAFAVSALTIPRAGAAGTTGVVTVSVTGVVTSSDSGSLVIDNLTSGGDHNAPVWQRIFWAVMQGVVASVLLLAGGLQALQTAEKLLNLGKRVYLVNLPDKDPSEMGFKAFTELIQQAEELDLSKLMLHKLDL